MGDDVKDEPTKPKETTLIGKAGWLKKSSGKFLGSYKDRYIQLDKTEIAVYENEDLKNCVERLDLENYDKCHELRSPFKKKYRLILIRAPKSASKVCDIKLQAQNQEEKEAWIKALSDGINRAKNKIFDEVKVDESLSLDHVTRSRPKGNRGRRPPTRIHMKEAASISSDGILRLDLDTEDNMPNGSHFLMDGADGEAKAAPAKSFDDISEEPEDTAPQKKVLKPPMPPSKENKPSESQECESKLEEPAPQKKILMPPMPPSKEQKPSENTEEEKESEEETVVKPPMPPSKENKPRISSNGDASEDTASENGESATTLGKSSPVQGETDGPETIHPPSPPSKDIKPKQAASLSDKETSSEDDEGSTSKENEKNEAESVETEDKPFTLSNNVPKPQGVMWDSPSSPEVKSSVDQNAKRSAEIVVSRITIDPVKPASEFKLTPHSTPEAVKKSAPPPAPPKKKPLKPPVKEQVVQDNPVVSAVASVSLTVSSSVEKGSESMSANETKPGPKEESKEEPKEEPKEERKIVILNLSNSGASEDLDDVAGVEAEVKSIDSGQLSAEDSESSEQVTPSTDKLQSSLEVLDGVTSEEELETPDSKVQNMDDPLSAILTMDDSTPITTESTCTPPISSPAAPLNSSLKKRSASTGDLIEEMKGLQTKVSLELEETGELLDKIAPKGSPEAGLDIEEVTDPQILLATAMEKLKKADQFLREAKNLKEQENKSNRTSW